MGAVRIGRAAVSLTAATPKVVRVAAATATVPTDGAPPKTVLVGRASVSVSGAPVPAVRVASARVAVAATVTVPTGVTARAGRLCTLTAELAGATAWEWSQASGPTVVWAATGGVVQFVAPYLRSPGSVVMQVRALSGGVWTGWTPVGVTVPKHMLWAKRNGDWKPALTRPSDVLPNPPVDPGPDPVLADTSTIPCYGDSMTAGFGLPAGSSWPSRLQESLPSGSTAVNYGVSGQTAQEIALRQGGMTINLSFPSNTIPASGSVTVTTPDGVIWGSTGFSAVGVVNGVTGVLARTGSAGTGGTITFTRSGSGSAVTVTGAVPWRSTAGDRGKVQVFLAGRNDYGIGGVDSVIRNRVVNANRAMVDYLTTPYFVVLSNLTTTSETTGTRGYNNVIAVNNQLASLYGDRFLDIRRWLIDNGLAALHITPTSADLAAIAGDTLPPSLMIDSIHWNAAVAELVADKVYERLVALRYLSAPDAAPVPTDGLFFKLPDMSASERKVLAHYFGPYPRSLNNASSLATDTYTTVYNNPRYTGVYGSEVASVFGGAFRDRPQYRPPISGDYKYQDCVWDIQQAKAAGIDGFFCDLLGLSGSNYDNYETLRKAANDLGGAFKVVPMIDANGATGAADAKTAAAYVKRFALGTRAKGSAYEPAAWFLPDGRFVVSCFKVEGKPLSWWQDLMQYLYDDWGLTVAFIGVAVNWNSSGTYTPVQYGSSAWGYGADPAVINNAGNYANTARARGEKFMAPVVGQDTRPQNSVFDECLNTSALRAAWEKAIAQSADYVQLVTWSDYSETAMAPSAANGWVNLDLCSWYITRWKTGSYPTILKDAIYLSHRGQTLDATITGPQTKTMAHWARASRSSLRNHVESLTFLKSPASVTVKVGSATYTYDAPAGMYVATFPVTGAVAAGGISASAARSGSTVASVTSPVGVRTSSVNDDKQYFRFSSVRGTTGQFDPGTQYT